MVVDLRATVINMKHLSQDIDDPVVINAADANGRRLRVIFTQEAAAQMTPDTKVYLSWYHQQKKIKGYNVFTEIPRVDEDRDPYMWEITYPASMLYCGDVLACIELVDDISISASTNFMIHVLENPNDGAEFVDTNDFTEFQTAVISLNSLADQIQEKMEQYQTDFEAMQLEHQYILTIVEETHILNTNMQELLGNIQDQVDAVLAECAATINELADNQTEAFTEWLEQANDTLSDYATLVNGFNDRLTAVEDNSVITVERNVGSNNDSYAYRYIFKQGGIIIENGIIDINKDMVATSGELVYPTVAEPIIIDNTSITSGTYIKMSIANGETFYIDVASLIEYNSVENTDEIILTDINHVITASINEIAAGKIVYQEPIVKHSLGSIDFDAPIGDSDYAYDSDASELIGAIWGNGLINGETIKVNIDGVAYDYIVDNNESSFDIIVMTPATTPSTFGNITLNNSDTNIDCPSDWDGGNVTFSFETLQPKQTVAEAIDELQNAIGTGGNVDSKISAAIDSLDARVVAPAGSAITGIRESNGVLTGINTVELNAQNIGYNNSTVSNTLNTIGTIPTAATATTVVNYVDEQVNNALTWNTIS